MATTRIPDPAIPPRWPAASSAGRSFIRHNPIVEGGPNRYIAPVKYMGRESPGMRLDVKRVFADGDIVVTHSNLILADDEPGLAVADFYRSADGKIVEHRDVI